jgi:hypothetical protein
MADEEKQARKIDEVDLRIEEARAGAPAIYVEGIAGAIVTNNLIKFNLYHDRPSIRPTVEEDAVKVLPDRRVVATLVMDINNFHSMFNMMQHLFQSLIQSGVIAMEPVGGSGGVDADRQGGPDQEEER